MKITKVITGEVSRLSIVDSPANQSFICSERLCSIDGNSITAVVLKANQLIYRKLGDRYFYIPSDIIEQLAHRFLEAGNNSNLSVQHRDQLEDGMALQESYVIDGVWSVKIALSPALLDEVHKGNLNGISVEMIAEEELIMEFNTKEELISKTKELDIATKKIIFGELINKSNE